ncbi:hypothetical protein ACWKWU_03070 [Chitinophaga lutea]
MSREEKMQLLHLLEQLKHDNVLLKQRLAYALLLHMPEGFLDRAEQLQLQFLQNDQALALLHHDLVMLYQQRHPHTPAYNVRKESLQQDLDRMQQEFEQLKELCGDLPPLPAAS